VITTFAIIVRKKDVKVLKQRKHPGAAMGIHATLTFSLDNFVVMCAVKICLLVVPV